jgi:hypothetical protein
LVSVVAAGCDSVPGADYRAVQRELLTTQEQVARLERQVAQEQQANRTLQEQVAQARGVDPQSLDQLVAPVKIQLEGQSGGFDSDEKAGHDGVILYIQPIDAQGHVIKVAGAIDVTVLDLAEPQGRQVVAECQFDVPTSMSLWSGRLWTHHFTVRCPFPPGRLPRHNELTVRVEFTDLLTGRTLTAQAVFQIELPPALEASASR